MNSFKICILLITITPISTFLCNTTNTWLVAENLDDIGTFPVESFQNDTFCESTEGLTNGRAFYTSTMLQNPDETAHFQQLTEMSFVLHKSNCQPSYPQIQNCISHCTDKNLELIVIRESSNSSDPATVARQIYNNLSTDYIVISAHFDLSSASQMISYDYFSDKSFCAVFVKIKNSGMFPYAMFSTISKIK